MTDEVIQWKAWKDMPPVYGGMDTMVYTECGLGRTQTFVRVMLKHGSHDRPCDVELFCAPARAHIDLRNGEVRALFLDDWFAAMQAAAAKYFAIQALKEPI